MKKQFVRSIVLMASRLSTSGRLLKESELEKLDVDQLRLLNTVLRDADQEIERERRTYKMFPGGPRIRM